MSSDQPFQFNMTPTTLLGRQFRAPFQGASTCCWSTSPILASIVINGVSNKRVDSAKLLGVTVSSDLSGESTLRPFQGCVTIVFRRNAPEISTACLRHAGLPTIFASLDWLLNIHVRWCSMIGLWQFSTFRLRHLPFSKMVHSVI